MLFRSQGSRSPSWHPPSGLSSTSVLHFRSSLSPLSQSTTGRLVGRDLAECCDHGPSGGPGLVASPDGADGREGARSTQAASSGSQACSVTRRTRPPADRAGPATAQHSIPRPARSSGLDLAVLFRQISARVSPPSLYETTCGVTILLTPSASLF